MKKTVALLLILCALCGALSGCDESVADTTVGTEAIPDVSGEVTSEEITSESDDTTAEEYKLPEGPIATYEDIIKMRPEVESARSYPDHYYTKNYSDFCRECDWNYAVIKAKVTDQKFYYEVKNDGDFRIRNRTFLQIEDIADVGGNFKHKVGDNVVFLNNTAIRLKDNLELYAFASEALGYEVNSLKGHGDFEMEIKPKTDGDYVLLLEEGSPLLKPGETYTMIYLMYDDTGIEGNVLFPLPVEGSAEEFIEFQNNLMIVGWVYYTRHIVIAEEVRDIALGRKPGENTADIAETVGTDSTD